jgi:hypothetical protein
VTSLAQHAASVHVTVTQVPGIKGPQTDLSLTRDGGAYGTLAGTSYSGQVLVRGSVGYYRVTLRVVSPTGAAHPGQYDFTQWNSAVIPPLPASSEVVTLAQLQAG